MRAAVLAKPGAAGFVVWPAAIALVEEGVPAPAVAVAIRIARDDALARHRHARAVDHDHRGLAAAGVAVDGGAGSLGHVLRDVATPGLPGEDTITRVLARLSAESGARQSPVAAEARDAVLGPLGGLGGLPPTPQLARIEAADVRRALVRLRQLPVEVRAAGQRGLAAQLAGSLAGRLGRTRAREPRSAAPGPPPRAIERGHGGPRTTIVLGYALPPASDGGPRAEAPLLAELLREGAGSLSQRLSATGLSAGPRAVTLEPLASGGGALVFEVEADPSRAVDAWTVLSGAVSSLRSLPPKEASLVEARRRLDARAKEDGSGAERAALRMLLPEAWRWPPPDRWTAPARPQDVQAWATRLLVPSARAVFVAGPRSEDVARHAARGAAARAGVLEDGGSQAAEAAIVGALRDALTSGGRTIIPRRFRGSYRVRESTPLGSVTSSLVVDGSPGSVGVTVGTARRSVSARAGEGASTVTFSEDGLQRTDTLPSADRVAALAYRQPAVLVLAAASGEAFVTETRADCARGTCPALRAELNDRSRLLVVLDPETMRPIELRTRWCCGEGADPPDEIVRYLSWIEKDGVEVAAEMEAIDRRGVRRSVVLLDWEWAPGHDRVAP